MVDRVLTFVFGNLVKTARRRRSSRGDISAAVQVLFSFIHFNSRSLIQPKNFNLIGPFIAGPGRSFSNSNSIKNLKHTHTLTRTQLKPVSKNSTIPARRG